MPNPIPLGPLVPPVPGLDQMLIDHPPDISSSSSPPSHDLPPRPSLKRSSSSPTFSPSHSSNPNPFVQNQSDPVLSLSFLSKPASQNFLGFTSSNKLTPPDTNHVLLLPAPQVSNGDLSLPLQ